MPLDPQAVELNEALRAGNPHVLEMLSERGRAIFFPKRGLLAQSAAAVGAKINATLGTALEDDGSPMALAALAGRVDLGDRQYVNYAPALGRPKLRAQWKQMQLEKNPGLGSQPFSLPVVTSALTHGLSMGGYLFAGPGDRVLLPDLHWENYGLVLGLGCGATLETYPTFSAGGFNVEGLRARLAEGPAGKKIILLNFPHNPTGYSVRTEEALRLREVLIEAAARGDHLVVFLDDAYHGLVFEEGVFRESLFSLLAGAHERLLAVKFDGPTKEDYVWGLRVGFVTFGCARSTPALYAALESKLGGAIRGNISNASNLGQCLLEATYASPDYPAQKREKQQALARRYQKVRQVFAAHPEYRESFEPLPFNSGYFLCVRVKGGDAERVQKILLDDHSTGVIALGDLVRVAFAAVAPEKLEQLFENLHAAVRKAVAAH